MLFENILQLLTNSSPTKQTSYKVGVKLLEIFQLLLQQLITLCDEKEIDISHLSLFKRDTTSID